MSARDFLRGSISGGYPLQLQRFVDMTKHRSPDERAEQILAAARQCFLEKGYFATRMNEIVRESGLSKGGIYFHFDSKKDILRSLVVQEYETAMERIDEVVDAETEITEMLIDLGRHFTEEFANTDKPRFMAIIAEMALRDDEIRQMLVELQQNYIDRMAEVIERGMDEGQLREVDPESAAILLKSIIDGMQASYGIGYDPDIDSFLESSMTILGRGMIADGASGEVEEAPRSDEE